ncbi:MAG: 7-carboxy-7-deazaguanine synthase QueE [Bacteroidia bacterium]|nr:7-carboxy-7-deazaguanine synthase QueE [Bacteroidia bacterium]
MSNKLPIMEHFYTVQGEGVHMGKPAYFIRIAGCNIGCVWCDVKDSWDAKLHSEMSISEILEAINKTKAQHVVITGGEPAMYDLTELCKALRNEEFMLHIETSGAYEIKGALDWICISPKKFKNALSSELIKAHELKVIVYNKHDLEWAKTFENQISKDCIKLLQPEWGVKEESEKLIIDFIKENPDWNISIQTHKYLDIP